MTAAKNYCHSFFCFFSYMLFASFLPGFQVVLSTSIRQVVNLFAEAVVRVVLVGCHPALLTLSCHMRWSARQALRGATWSSSGSSDVYISDSDTEMEWNGCMMQIEQSKQVRSVCVFHEFPRIDRPVLVGIQVEYLSFLPDVMETIYYTRLFN